MKPLKLISAVALIMSMTACNQASENNTQSIVPEGWTTLIENNYSINYPEDWELNQSGQMGTKFMLFSPLSSDMDQFNENVNLLVQDLTGHNLSLNKYVKLSEEQIKTLITDGEILESERVTTEPLAYQKIIYTGRQGIFSLKFEQYFWIVEETAYVLTLTCEENEFSNYRAVGEEILNSFNIR